MLQNDLITLPSNDGPNPARHLFLPNEILSNDYFYKNWKCNKDLRPLKPKIFTIWTLQNKCVNLWHVNLCQHSKYSCFLQKKCTCISMTCAHLLKGFLQGAKWQNGFRGKMAHMLRHLMCYKWGDVRKVD